MKEYCLLLLALSAAQAWSLGHSPDAKELSSPEQRADGQIYGQAAYWDPERHRYYRTIRNAYRGRELFGKRSGKPIFAEDGRQKLMEMLEQAQMNNELQMSVDDNGVNHIVVSPEVWARFSDYYRYTYGVEPFQRERRRRRTQRELFG